MRSAASVLLMATVVVFTLIDCDRKRTPTGPGETGYTLRGRIVYASSQSQGCEGIIVRITGSGIDSTITTDTGGRFTLSGIGDGFYTLLPSMKNWAVAPDSITVEVAGADVALDDIAAERISSIGAGNRAVCGKIETFFSSVSPKMLRSFTLRIEDDSGALVQTVSASAQFYFAVPEGIYTITPEKEGYEFTFTPPAVRLEPGRALDRCIFRGEYTGAPLHSISGTMRNTSGGPVYHFPLELEGGGERIRAETDSLGQFVFSHIRDGDYTVRSGVEDRYTLVPSEISVTLTGGDVEIPDLSYAYIGPTMYRFSGRIVDREGRAVPGVKLYRSEFEYIQLGEDGKFSIGGYPTRENPEETLVYRPQKRYCAFSPDSIKVVCRWREGIDEYRTTIPDVICTDYRDFTVADYFPLSSTSSWNYERTVNDGMPSERTVSVDGESVVGGLTYRKLSPDGPAGFRLFRIEGEEVFTVFSDQDARFLRFGVVPGSAWTVGFIAGTYPYTGVFHGLEKVETPAGIFEDCLSFELRKVYGTTTYETWTLWLARGIGMIRSERTLVNYGETRERVVDVLKTYTP